MMQRFGFTACALLVSALVLVPPTMAKDTHLSTAGPDRLLELSGKPAQATSRGERLAQIRDHRKRSPDAAVVAPPAAGKAITRDHRKRSPGAAVVAPPAAGKGITVRGNLLEAKPGYILEAGPNNQIMARRIGGSPGVSVSVTCVCEGEGAVGECAHVKKGDVAYCLKTRKSWELTSIPQP